MQTRNQIVEDVSRVLSGLAGTVAGAGREVETRAREKLREAVGGLDLVSRDEFEAVRAMAANARAEVEMLRAEVAALRAAGTGAGPAAGGASGSADGSQPG